ncbi:MAG: chromosome segregation protein SMC [Rhodospirillaceae bacterium]|nr:MAG: chromosome segregation protein SMC [Rhodospirillaceae bacterium]
MQFNRMRLTGFKSFVEPTELVIDDGLTGVVGPNGCGKSNLVEALRWAMGETSAKQMRGGEMDDVIFAGTSDRPARNLAEVILSLDNSDRRAPAQFNGSDELDVVRRIERGHGSNYKVNGMDARARDVQTLFADASTGARSTAMVSQGRIGAIINAKPTQRRGLLEEAAGITGLHARRHEAELRLRAAEINLERLEDVVGALEEQHRLLKRQARQATRYRNLSDHIKRHEAILLHLRWTMAQSERAAAAEQFAQIETLVAELTQAVATATTAQAKASSALPDLREKEAEAAAALQRLMVARDALDAEERRIETLRDEIQNRVAQIDADIGREKSLSRDAAEAVENLELEATEIRAAQTREADDLATAKARLLEAEAEVEQRERELTELTRSVVADETRGATLNRQLTEFEIRRRRFDDRLANITREKQEAEAAADDNGALDRARKAADEARHAAAAARTALLEAEGATTDARLAENYAREERQSADSAAAKLRAEQEALAELLEFGDPELWPPMIDAVEVDTGYEVALGAALGDDLIAPTDEASPIHWRVLPMFANPRGLPGNIYRLSDFVRGPAALMRRLSQIGVVENDAQGQRLHGELEQGQRLVSTNGSLWRWDGYIAAAGAPTAAATRLAQRNRLDEMRNELETSEAKADDARVQYEQTAAAARDAADAERGAREAVWTADADAQNTNDEASMLAESTVDARSRVSSLKDAIDSLNADVAELETQEKAACEELEGLADVGDRRRTVEEKHVELVNRRASLAEIRSAHDRLDQESETRALRLQVIANDLESWKNRSVNALKQLEQLTVRRAQELAELDKLKARPQEIATERSALLDRIQAAEAARNEAADNLAAAENRLEELTRELRNRENRLSETREDRVRREAAVEQIDQSLKVIAERIMERLECAPEDSLSSVRIDEEDELPPQDAVETKLERLQRERDNMGPVNLRAEQEAAELDEKIRGMETEREDLIAAIARLRHGISGLNREARERLLAAFNEVDEHFRELFAKLFGGGRAHLRLTEAEDPLEAGLEVFASPPGKRLQSMTLLSGGEQALTALALLFAVFLTNPAPICVLDEVDAPLDDSNVDRFCTLLDEMSRQSSTRFLLVTHHRLTMARMDRLYGVTMSERGVSQLVSVDLQTAERLRETA